jgi:hypothetical protein
VQALMASPTKRDQVGLRIVAKGPSPFHMMNVQILEGSAVLRTPTVRIPRSCDAALRISSGRSECGVVSARQAYSSRLLSVQTVLADRWSSDLIRVARCTCSLFRISFQHRRRNRFLQLTTSHESLFLLDDLRMLQIRRECRVYRRQRLPGSINIRRCAGRKSRTTLRRNPIHAGGLGRQLE